MIRTSRQLKDLDFYDIYVLETLRPQDPEMKVLWKNYQEIFDYAEGINWEEIMKTVKEVYTRIGIDI
ncbi:MAG: hypothetical protein GX363_06530 [Clostridiales bacterium]|jgi:hypothetical protein|nr:hypothetical protein [Clostridiales bacterium]